MSRSDQLKARNLCPQLQEHTSDIQLADRSHFMFDQYHVPCPATSGLNGQNALGSQLAAPRHFAQMFASGRQSPTTTRVYVAAVHHL